MDALIMGNVVITRADRIVHGSSAYVWNTP
jgi:hypothetical protein